jgi:hypothetical protein
MNLKFKLTLRQGGRRKLGEIRRTAAHAVPRNLMIQKNLKYFDWYNFNWIRICKVKIKKKVYCKDLKIPGVKFKVQTYRLSGDTVGSQDEVFKILNH